MSAPKPAAWRSNLPAGTDSKGEIAFLKIETERAHRKLIEARDDYRSALELASLSRGQDRGEQTTPGINAATKIAIKEANGAGELFLGAFERHEKLLGELCELEDEKRGQS